MASVAICPHCYLQLVVPDGVAPDERVECPTCAKEFGLDQAVLRPIPEVVRHVQTAERAAVEELVAEVVEVEEIVFETDGGREAAVIEEIKARIEAEIAAKGLQPGTESMLPLELPADDDESLATVEQSGDELAASFRHAKTVPELPPIGELEQFADDAKSQAADEAAMVEELTVVEEVGEVVELAALVDEPTEYVPEPLESRLTKPTVRTLADLLPPREERKEIDAAPGPSFDLPNVPLSPSNGATVEIDSSLSIGPAAETEFELDDVDFESMPAEELAAEEPGDASEPVFREPEAAAISAMPFVLPGIPRARKKRSVVRTLVGTALGGVVGLSLGYFILLYVLGPEGDFLRVAQYIPSTVLPKSFHSVPAQVAEAAPMLADEATTNSTQVEESDAVPAGYAEETKTSAEPAALDEPATDDRYGTEPSPLEEPAAEPIADETPSSETSTPSTTVAPLPLRGPTFTVEQLATALEAGKAAQAGLVTGDLNDAATRRTKGMNYAKLCDLAEALTFVDRSSSVESEQAIESADRLFRETLADEHTRSEVARIAQIWIDSPHRGHGGIFLAGTVSGGQIAGDVYEYELTTEDGSTLTLLMHQPLDPAIEGSENPVAIVGSIVDNPADQIAGYHGTAQRAIWITRAIPLD